MLDSLTSGEFIVAFFFGGMILRFGFKCADFVLDGYKQMMHLPSADFLRSPGHFRRRTTMAFRRMPSRCC